MTRFRVLPKERIIGLNGYQDIFLCRKITPTPQMIYGWQSVTPLFIFNTVNYYR
jgi:hypothetical protein